MSVDAVKERALFLVAKRDPRLVSIAMSWMKPTCFYYRRCLHTNLGSIYLSICDCETKLVTTSDETNPKLISNCTSLN